jgi:hypothetical protein
LLFCAVASAILQQSLLRVNSIDAPFASAVEIDIQGLPIMLYVVAICTAFISPIVADAFSSPRPASYFPDRLVEPPIRLEDKIAMRFATGSIRYRGRGASLGQREFRVINRAETVPPASRSSIATTCHC